MASISLSLDRDLSNFVQSQILAGVASTPEDYLRFLVKQQMAKHKNSSSIIEA
jgi:hypothetical protein